MTKKGSFRKRFNFFFFLLNGNYIKWHHLNNYAKFKKLNCAYSRCAFERN